MAEQKDLNTKWGIGTTCSGLEKGWGGGGGIANVFNGASDGGGKDYIVLALGR